MSGKPIQGSDLRAKLDRNVREYLLNSSIHGLKYIGDVALTFTERAFFFLAFVVVCVLSGYFISNLWQKWSETPIIIALNSAATDLNDIPFPAVTICNMNQARKEIADVVKNRGLEGILLESVCSMTEDFQSNNTTPFGYGTWAVFRNFLLNISQPCKEMIKYCRYAMEEEKCMEIFSTSLTDEGLCCTFNDLHPEYMFYQVKENWDLDPTINKKYKPIDWNPELGFSETTLNNTYPRRAIGAGSHMGLTIILNADVSNYFCSSTSSIGFKVLLHNPTETPKISNFGFYITTGEEYRAVIEPKLNDASFLIRNVPIQQRQCYFASEGNLSYFRTYSKKNCEMECESKYLATYCGCVLYYMPKVGDDVKICNRQDLGCYEHIRIAIEAQNNNSFTCSCLPACFEISYGRTLSSAKLGYNNEFILKDDFLDDLPNSEIQRNIAILNIFFSDSSFRSFTKGELIGFTEFLSSTGGLLGLFMGFSVLSLVEIIYFISLRPYFVNRAENLMVKKENKKVSGKFKNKSKRWFTKRKIAWIKANESQERLNNDNFDNYTPFPYVN